MNLFAKKKVISLLLILSAAFSLFAADSDDAFFMDDDDALFGGGDAFFSDDDMFSGEDDMFSDSMIDEGNAIESETPLDFDISNIYAEKVFRFGCSLSFSLDGMFLWYDPYKDGNRNPKFVK
ncbi:MAG: hypothetical protein II973_06865 [Spirochaetaceae bacterium]|nr:hypothetical protein [Spirochaetaceae bacterium]